MDPDQFVVGSDEETVRVVVPEVGFPHTGDLPELFHIGDVVRGESYRLHPPAEELGLLVHGADLVLQEPELHLFELLDRHRLKFFVPEGHVIAGMICASKWHGMVTGLLNLYIGSSTGSRSDGSKGSRCARPLDSPFHAHCRSFRRLACILKKPYRRRPHVQEIKMFPGRSPVRVVWFQCLLMYTNPRTASRMIATAATAT